MLSTRNFRIGVLALIAGACFAASQGRDFSGSYLWRNPIVLTDHVVVHVELTVRNAGEDVQDAQIILRGQYDDRETSLFRTAVSIKHGERVDLSGELSVSKQEFALWNGRAPQFILRVAADGGGYRDQGLDLIRKVS